MKTIFAIFFYAVSLAMLIAGLAQGQVSYYQFNQEMAAASSRPSGGGGGLDPHLLAQWITGDAGAGTCTDTLNRCNGTVYGATATSNQLGVTNAAYHFSDAYIALPFSTNLSQRMVGTVSGWVRQSGYGTMLSFGNDESTILTYTFLDYYVYATSMGSYSATYVNNNDGTTWHLFTATFDGTNFWCYRDAQLLNDMVDRTTITHWIGGETGLDNMNIGRMVKNATVYYMQGDLSDIRMYDYAMSATDVTNKLYNPTKP